MEYIFEWVKVIGSFLIGSIIIIFLIHLNEEDPHTVTINGKEYIRSKEYTGNGTYQVILTPLDSTNKNAEELK
jgi:hypothetical protein